MPAGCLIVLPGSMRSFSLDVRFPLESSDVLLLPAKSFELVGIVGPAHYRCISIPGPGPAAAVCPSTQPAGAHDQFIATVRRRPGKCCGSDVHRDQPERPN